MVGKALEGAASAGAETEKTDLYPQTFKGCVSCFSCKRKGGKTNGLCAVRDELTSILKKAPETDAIIIRSPVYYSYEIPYYADYQHRFIEKNTGKV